MFMMMILSYAIASYLDLKTTYHKQDKAKLIVYFILMTISYAIGTASGYVREMPSPAEPIKQLIFAIMGK
ncbi:MAG: hypothetical protein K0S75_2754 [Clostridia bacterium]|jgi:hypothetical protein|nr:hypothetical protein [Clostridia bacterium]